MNSTKNKLNSKIGIFVLLHIILCIYSLGGICSKMASKQELFSPAFIVFYGLVLLDMVIYAVLWQQILKKISLTTAFSNKAVTVIWGMLWGNIIFDEEIKWNMVLGTIIVLLGITFIVRGESEKNE